MTITQFFLVAIGIIFAIGLAHVIISELGAKRHYDPNLRWMDEPDYFLGSEEFKKRHPELFNRSNALAELESMGASYKVRLLPDYVEYSHEAAVRLNHFPESSWRDDVMRGWLGDRELPLAAGEEYIVGGGPLPVFHGPITGVVQYNAGTEDWEDYDPPVVITWSSMVEKLRSTYDEFYDVFFGDPLQAERDFMAACAEIGITDADNSEDAINKLRKHIEPDESSVSEGPRLSDLEFMNAHTVEVRSLCGAVQHVCMFGVAPGTVYRKIIASMAMTNRRCWKACSVQVDDDDDVFIPELAHKEWRDEFTKIIKLSETSKPFTWHFSGYEGCWILIVGCK